MKPLVERLQRDYDGTVEFGLYGDDSDAVGDSLAQQFNVQYVPTFVFVNADGSVAGQPVVGELGEAALRERLDALK